MVHFVGAGPGSPELLTLKGKRLIERAEVLIYAGSLVSPSLLSLCADKCRLYNSAKMDLQQIITVIKEHSEQGREIVRLHSGDPSLFGAILEQMEELYRLGIPYDITPGVSSFLGAAAALKTEYTVPGLSQTVILTRMAGRTPVGERDDITSLAEIGAAMAVFLSAGMIEELQTALLSGAYSEDTPAALVYKVSWPEERILRCTLGELADISKKSGIHSTALVLVGDFLSKGALTQAGKSRLYDSNFSTGYRKANNKDVGHNEDSDSGKKRGCLFIVGIGPGNLGGMTLDALKAIEQADYICGYELYVKLVRDIFPSKQFFTTPMRAEKERCQKALDMAMSGKIVALVCSGDSGIYGMAGLVLEMRGSLDIDVEIEIVPGVSAAMSLAAVLGAPLNNDFCVISLSDLMTPWEKIEKRLVACAEADFALCLYNPGSHSRSGHLKRACEILMRSGKSEDTVCGYARNIGREAMGEEPENRVMTLKELSTMQVDMLTTVFIGSSDCKVIEGRIVNLRGY